MDPSESRSTEGLPGGSRLGKTDPVDAPDSTRIRAAIVETAERFRRLRRIRTAALIGLGVSFLTLPLTASASSPQSIRGLSVLGGAASMIALVITLILRDRIHCPGCRHRIVDAFGSICPTCGTASLQPSDTNPSPVRRFCRQCRRVLQWGKGCDIQVRHCTHCGIQLDEKGLAL
ncbi:MAG: hypothetical protein HYR88_12940 [Verrucomicrobia bacterium]|nr:hypothetical protein [Verrucomicrobiota bacterium]MBI3866962.1 hypothetical protein [Verrucomicrobiota bacterium]